MASIEYYDEKLVDGKKFKSIIMGFKSKDGDADMAFKKGNPKYDML